MKPTQEVLVLEYYAPRSGNKMRVLWSPDYHVNEEPVFTYNGPRYETVQDALNNGWRIMCAGGTGMHGHETIVLTRDNYMRMIMEGLTVPTGQDGQPQE